MSAKNLPTKLPGYGLDRVMNVINSRGGCSYFIQVCYSFLSSSTQLPRSIDPALAVAVFQSQQDVLLVAICSCLTTLANKLLAKFVITQEISEKARNSRNESRERASYLLSCVQDRIKTEPADFIKVVDILESEPTLTRQARQLVESYCEYIIIIPTSIQGIREGANHTLQLANLRLLCGGWG